MKHVAILALVLTTLLLVLLPISSASTWHSYREDITTSSGTIDFDVDSLNVTYTSGETTTNLSLPCNLTNLDGTTSIWQVNTSGTNITFNLTVNGVAVNESSAVNWTTGGGNWSNVTLSDVIAAGVDADNTYLDVAFNATGTCTLYGRAYADDAAITSTWLSNNVAVLEKDVTDPYIGVKSSRSFFTVNDSITVSNDLGFTITDVNLTPTFSDQTITETDTYFLFDIVSDGSSSTQYAQYQKRGPYVFRVNEKSTNEVEIYIYSYELLNGVVDWELETTDDEYDGLFSNINYNTLAVTLNGASKDWSKGSVVFEELTIRDDYSNNKFNFAWTSSAYAEPTEISISEEETVFGFSTFFIATILFAVVILVVVGYILYNKKY